MSLAQQLTPDGIVFVDSRTKEEVFRLLAGRIARAHASLDQSLLVGRILDRERVVSTKVGPGVAIPHAVVDEMKESRVAVAVSRGGIAYDSHDEPPVHIICLVVGGRDDHLRILGEIARILGREGIIDLILQAPDSDHVFRLLTDPLLLPGTQSSSEELLRSRAVFEQGVVLAATMGAGLIVVYPDSVGNLAFMDEAPPGTRTVIATSDPSKYEPVTQGVSAVVRIPFRGTSRTSLVETGLLFILSRELLNRDDRVISIFGDSRSGHLDTIVHTDVAARFQVLFGIRDSGRSLRIDETVFARALQVAGELAMEGREGSPVGTIFVVGDYETVSGHCQQLVINPFKGYDADDRNILDPSLEETLKEFSRLDGAFVVADDGCIMSAGTYLRVDVDMPDHESGLGTRHAAARAITSVSRSVAIAVSESTRKISIFSGGERVVVL